MSGPAAFSPIMPLVLESGYIEAKENARIKKIADAKAAKEAEEKRIADEKARIQRIKDENLRRIALEKQRERERLIRIEKERIAAEKERLRII